MSWCRFGLCAIITLQQQDDVMSHLDRIELDPQRSGGRPTIRNTRLRVSDLLDLLAAGASRDEILEDYPFLEADDISAALEFAARHVGHTILRVA